MATQSKAQFLGDVLNLLKKRYKMSASTQKFTVLEAVVYGICHEDATRAQADQALDKFKTGFFDWNEVRVSSIAEIQTILEGFKLPNAEERANKVRRFLRQLFERSYSFNLEPLTKKPLKDSIKLLQEYEALSSDFVLATVIRLALGGHAIGIDVPTRRVLERMAVAEPDVDAPTLRGALERAIPKTRGVEFVDLIEELAHDTCVAGEPDCPHCEVKKICPKIITVKAEAPAPAPAVKSSAKAAAASASAPTAKPSKEKLAAGAKPAAPGPDGPAAKSPAPAKSAKQAPPAPAAPAPKAAVKPAPKPAEPNKAVTKPVDSKPALKPAAKSAPTPAPAAKASAKPAAKPAPAAKGKKPDKSK